MIPRHRLFQQQGLAVRMDQRVYRSPSLGGILEGLMMPQKLPSLVSRRAAGRVGGSRKGLRGAGECLFPLALSSLVCTLAHAQRVDAASRRSCILAFTFALPFFVPFLPFLAFIVGGFSTQVAAYVLAPQPGSRVLDMCSSPGGKTTAIAQLMQNEGEVGARGNAAA